MAPEGEGADVTARIAVYHGEADVFFSPEEVAAFHAEMDKTGADCLFVTLPGALHASDPPNPLDVWRLSAYGAQAFLLHVYGQTRSGFAEALDEQAKRLDVSPPRFPKRDPKDMRKTTRAAYDYLTQKWSPAIVYRWEFRHADTSRALFSIPLLAISLRMDYAPGASWVKPKSAMLKRHARYASLPPKLILPLTNLLDAGASVGKVHRAIADLFLDVETHYKQQAAAEPER